MNRSKLRIIFLGNPEFAKVHLERLLDEGFNVVAVVSAADKPGGRGMKLLSTPVTDYARKLNIPLLQPKNLKDQNFQDKLAQFNADLQVVIAFRMLPVSVWDMPPMGTINLHASLLPDYRGAAPINWVIINGETETGVTTFKLKHEIDTGNLLLQQSIKIEDHDTAGSLHDKLMHLGADTLVQTLDGVISNSIKEKEQVEPEISHAAPKIYSDDCVVNWNQNQETIRNFIRGLNPYPVARTLLNNKQLKIFDAQIIPDKNSENLEPGSFISDNKSFIHVVCSDGLLSLKSIQIEGKRKMLVDEFLRGNSI